MPLTTESREKENHKIHAEAKQAYGLILPQVDKNKWIIDTSNIN